MKYFIVFCLTLLIAGCHVKKKLIYSDETLNVSISRSNNSINLKIKNHSLKAIYLSNKWVQGEQIEPIKGVSYHNIYNESSVEFNVPVRRLKQNESISSQVFYPSNTLSSQLIFNIGYFDDISTCAETIDANLSKYEISSSCYYNENLLKILEVNVSN